MNNLPILPQEELERISADFYGKDYTEATPEKKKEFDDAYRRVEEDTNKQILDAGSVQAWYESGQGRLLYFNIKQQ